VHRWPGLGEVMALDWLAVDRCETAAQFGWFVGVWTGAIADIVIIAVIASAPKLGSRRPLPGALRNKTRTVLRHSLWTLALVWLWGGYHAFAFVTCYTTTLGFGCALTIAIILLLAMLTAANQIGARSVR
jgi:hypothetical protein